VTRDRVLWVSRAVTPSGLRERVRVVLDGSRISEVSADVAPAAGDEVFDGALLLPGLIDLQVNGGDGAAYASSDADERARATHYHLSRGTTSLLATLVTAPLDELELAIGRLAAEVTGANPVLGIHVEGPFLAPAKCGAHAAEHLCDPTPETANRLLESARGTLRMLTLAPERPGALDAIAQFARAGAVVAAGHSLATYDELQAAIGAGLSFVTHVGNASDWPSRPMDHERGYRRSEPGLVGTFLIDQRLSGSLILDGHHIHPDLARALIAARGPASIALVSDATPAAGRPPGRYRLGSLEAEVREGGYAVAPGGGLAGSVITLLDAVRIAVDHAGIPLVDAVTMASEVPAHLIGHGQRKGVLRAGADADLLLLDDEWRVLRVIRAGAAV
jgi:N-acetylglucosamine-6-phosphate deacetylase